jgi:hypothetical protein
MIHRSTASYYKRLGYDIQMVAVLNHLMRSQSPSLMFHQRYFNINNRQQIMQLQQQK